MDPNATEEIPSDLRLSLSVQNLKTNKCLPLFLSKDVVVIPNSIALWHLRIGYAPFVKLKHIPSINQDIRYSFDHVCTICPQAKQTRTSFPISNSIAKDVCELLHCDV